MGSPPLKQHGPVDTTKSPGEWRLSSAGLYVIASGGSSLLGLIAVAVLARVLGPSVYGVGEAAAAVLVLGAAVALLGLDTSVALAIHADPSGDREQRRIVAGSAIVVVAVGSVVLGVVIFLARDIVAAALLRDEASATVVGVVALSLPFVALHGLGMALSRNLGRADVFLVSVIGAGIVQCAVSAAAALGGVGAASAVVGTGAGAGAGAAIAFLRLRREVRLRTASVQAARRLLVVGLPLVPAAIAAWAIAASDRLLLLAIVDARDVGLYAAAAKVAAGAAVLVSAFTLGWSPYALRIQHRPSAAATYRDVLTLYAFVAGVVVVFSSLLGPVAVSVLAGSAYAEAGSVVWLLVGGALAYGGYLIVSIGIQVVGRTSLIALTSIAAAVINVALNLVLLPLVGYAGAGFSTLAAYLASATFVLVLAQRLWPVPYDVLRVALTVAIPTAGSAIVAFSGLPPTGQVGVMALTLGAMVASAGPISLRRAAERLAAGAKT